MAESTWNERELRILEAVAGCGGSGELSGDRWSRAGDGDRDRHCSPDSQGHKARFP